MTSRRNFLKGSAALTAATGIVGGWEMLRGRSHVLVISSHHNAATARSLVAQMFGNHKIRHVPEHEDRENPLRTAIDHLRQPGNTLVAMPSPALHVLLGMAIRDTGARLVEERHHATHPLFIARS